MFAKWHGKSDGRIQIWYGLRSLGAVSTDLFKEVVQRAKSHQMRMTMHLGEVIDDVRYVKQKNYPNLTTFARDVGLLGPSTVFAHGVHFDDTDLKALAETKCNVSHCPASNMKLASGFAKVPEMLRLGVPVSLGCDGGPSNNTYDMIREMRLAALIHKSNQNDPTVVSAENVMEMATIGGAAALGLQDKVGSLERGKLADLILVDLKDIGLTPAWNPVSNLVYAGSGKCVDTVVVNGRVLMRRKRLLTLNEPEIMTEANERLAALLSRANVRIEPKWPVS
jgi:cytosine/adenosine deaminase-related metal-dependent hydrolase